jgi:hypothetical protein
MFRALAELTLALVGLLFAEICLTGSARTMGMYLIILFSVIFIINERTKKEE